MGSISVHDIRERDLRPRWWATRGMALVLRVGMSLPGRRVQFDVVGKENLPTEPCIIVTNHTHRMDWLAMRFICYRLGRMQVNWVKPRTYEEGMARFLDLTGNVPLASRGYLISADFREVHGRAPSESEYRAIRDHLDHDQPLPSSPPYDTLLTTARKVLGLPYDPESDTYRLHLETVFHQMMQATLARTRQLMALGCDLAIMPQGAIAPRLTQGHPGAIQAAHALSVPIVPVGISNFPQVWGGGDGLPAHGGRVRVEIGKPIHLASLPGFTPFLPSSEREFAPQLQASTAEMMEAINALLSESHRWGTDRTATEVQGVARFV